MTDEQVWTDLARFAEAMKRGATVFFNNGIAHGAVNRPGTTINFACVRGWGGINEIIEPPQKKVRPLNADEWKSVAGCVFIRGCAYAGFLETRYPEQFAIELSSVRATCHPPGFPADVRKLWVEE